MKFSKFSGLVAVAVLAVGSFASTAEARTISPGASATSIRNALQAGGRVVFSRGTYTFRNELDVTLGSNDLTVIAWGATFVADNIDGDLFGFKTNSRTNNANFTWNGGTIDMRRQRLSTVRPVPNIDARSGRVGRSATADGLSVRGGDQLNRVLINRVTVISSNGNWRSAGGDSGIFVNNSANVTVQNSRLIGCRDAGIYVSDTPGGKNGRYTLNNNYGEGCYVAFTVKRGADNVRVTNSVMVDNLVGMGLAPAGQDNLHRNATFTGNFITGSDRAAVFTNFANLNVQRNRIYRKSNKVDFKTTNGDQSVATMRRNNTVVNRLANSNEIRAERNRRGL